MSKNLEKPDLLDQKRAEPQIPSLKKKLAKYSYIFIFGFLISAIIFQAENFLRHFWLIILGFFLIGSSFLAIWLIPTWQAKILDQMKGGKSQSEFDLSKEKIKLRDDLRKTVSQIIAGLFFLLNVLVAYSTFSLNQESLQTDRFAKTMSYLNDKSETIRKGSLITLDRISKESAEYNPRIMDILASYIREKSAEQRNEFQQLNKLTPNEFTTQNIVLPTNEDILLAFEIIRNSKRPIEYSNYIFNLRKANFSKTDLNNLVLSNIDFSEVELKQTNLSGTKFTNIKFNSANFYKSNLSGSIFANYINFVNAKMVEVNLEGAYFTEADLSSADLSLSSLKHAKFGNTNFSDANLNLVDLSDADLRNCFGLTIEQISKSVINENTQLPNEIEKIKNTLLIQSERNLMERKKTIMNVQ